MLINTLCALCLGFVLDSMFGDVKAGLYPLNIMKKYILFLQCKIMGAYSDSKDAQRVAGGMFSFLAIATVLIVCLLLFFVSYSISNVIGIVVEGIMCWSAISAKTPRLTATGIMRAVKGGNISGAQKKLAQLTDMDVSQLEYDDIIRCTVETTSANITDYIVAPIIYIAIFGGVGGMVYRCINLLDRLGGRMSGDEESFGKTPTAINNVVSFVPSRIAGVLSMADVSFLSLDSKNAVRVHNSDRNRSENTNASQTQSVCAGAVGISVLSGYPNGVPAEVGQNLKPCEPMDIYWANQIATGAEMFIFILSVAVRVGIFFIF